jgi:RNA polymerase sigma factor (sigma-70 family)
LAALEIEFRQFLISHPWGEAVYQEFISYICDERKNILAARPFFRERQETFTAEISNALKIRNVELLYKFHINFQFISFVACRFQWSPDSQIIKLAQQIADLRTELTEMNMPLAISRARIFWSRTPKSQLTYMDLIQIACEGLISAIDKFVLPFSRVFRAVAIGRITGNFIQLYSETLVHFFPVDKSKLYRANKLISKFSSTGHVDYEKLSEAVNIDVDNTHRTDASEIADLLSAASCLSIDCPPANQVEGEIPVGISRFAAPSSSQPDIQYENYEVMTHLEKAILCLPLREQKLLKMHGVML